jgi:glutamate-1-semialdehyde 2,1-aminomutase
MKRNLNLSSALADARMRYADNNPQSKALHEAALQVLPGGNTRSVLHFDPFPLVVNRGEGARVWDADGHQYTDFLGEYTAGLFGHSHPQIQNAVKAALARGTLLCGPNEDEAELARILCERFPSVDRVRFTNSGTEANLMAVAAARVHTGKDGLLVMHGGYHGGVFMFKGGNNRVNAPYPYYFGAFNDSAFTTRVIEQHATEIAAIMVEPVMGTSGAIPATGEFLRALRDAADRHNIVLLFDEVMTSRVSAGGAQQHYGVIPDMTSFGKYIGGGLTFGAFGGRAEIMDLYDPRRADALPHAGTFNNNVLTMAAGVTAMRDLYPSDLADAHSARGEAFKQRINELAASKQVAAQVTGLGSLLCLHFCSEPVTTPEVAATSSADTAALCHLFMLERGFYTSKTGLMSLALPLEALDYDRFVDAFGDFADDYGPLLRADSVN